MSRRTASRAYPTPASPVVINVDGIAAGFALRDTWRFRFFSGHPRFDLLDGSRFSRIEDVRWAVKRLANATEEKTSEGPSRISARTEDAKTQDAASQDTASRDAETRDAGARALELIPA
jgi:hypothetical protein